MRNELKHIELIENYLLGKLNNDQKTAFELELQSNLKLQEEVDSQKKIMNRLAVLAFANDIENFHPEFIAQEGKGGKFKWFLNSIIVIIVAGITSLGIYFSNAKESKKNSKSTVQQTEITGPKSEKTNTLLALNEPELNVNYSNISNNDNDNSNSTLSRLSNSSFGNNSFGNKKQPNVVEPGEDFVPDENTANNDTLSSDSTTTNLKTTEEDIFSRLQVPFEEVKIQAHIGGTFTTKNSKSKFTVPAGILQFEDGETVYGQVTIKYREWRNAAEMAFCQIPMTHQENGEDFSFNSAGMFEIRAYQNGKELKIAPDKEISVDFKVTEKLDSCYFWSLDDDSQKWERKDTLNNLFNSNNRTIRMGDRYYNGRESFGMLTGKLSHAADNRKVELNNNFRLSRRFLFLFYKNFQYSPNYTDTGYVFTFLKKGTYKATVNDPNYERVKVKKIKVKNGMISNLDMELASNKNNIGMAFKSKIKLENYTKEIPVDFNPYTYSNEIAESAMQQWNNQAIVNQTLSCNKFGVYNCDQVKRISNPIQVRPSYTNTDNDELKTSNAAIVSMIDLRRNSAFSFGAKEFTCSPNGKIVVLLFNDNRVYAIPEQSFSELKIKRSGNYNLKMEDITDKIKSTKDLEKYLGISSYKK